MLIGCFVACWGYAPAAVRREFFDIARRSSAARKPSWLPRKAEEFLGRGIPSLEMLGPIGISPGAICCPV
eukprot:Skav227416  [mRNA]  locus=scaffold950:153621:154455:- [translate_table: standard]